MNCRDLQKDTQGSCGETCPASCDTNQIMSIKVEDVSDTEEEEDPVPLKVSRIKSEHELQNCMTLQDMQGSCSESSPASHDADQIARIKVEDVSDIEEEEEDPMSLKYSGIKTEHVNCMDLEKDVSFSSREACPVYSYDANNFVSIKVEEVSGIDEEQEDPLLLTSPQRRASKRERPRVMAVNAEHAEVLKAAKTLFCKRHRTLCRWLSPSTTKRQLNRRVSDAWATLPEIEKNIYISEVLGRFGTQGCAAMMNPRLDELKGPVNWSSGAREGSQNIIFQG
ncbi:hypothetical protein B7P43_G11836 [Cryptotermes secundus]|uniref:Uncharacterized protein n=1 Tax=Cryptotermes secundus TaxID=105785 RepID=A0A2J7RQ19_9NEOP|nr:hypothetical protein B7P43_G11836 [Cryptotermes secundus]PNF42936.1 hypothetical protein B7P43_G11836 [Cryptotermes secundus]